MVRKIIQGEHTGQIARGELCINEEVLCSSKPCEEPGFAETYAFLCELKQDIISLSPRYPCNPKHLPERRECLLPELTPWVEETSLFTFAVLDGAFEWGMRVFGLQEFCMMLKKIPPALTELIRRVEKLNLDMAEELASEGIDAILLADDVAYQNGLFASPALLREIFLPSLARQVENMNSHGLPVFFHSDGDYRLIFDDIVNCGFAGLQCLEKKAGMDIADLLARVGEKLCLWGHLDVGDIAGSADPSRQRLLVDEIRTLASGGRFILGTTSGIFSGMDISLLQELYRLLDES
jgi:uroporphyrinogen decarboxylase